MQVKFLHRIDAPKRCNLPFRRYLQGNMTEMDRLKASPLSPKE